MANIINISKKRILMVEDNSEIQEFNKRLLEGKDFIIEAAMNISGAKNIIARNKPDAIVLDIGLPDGSGLEFLRELRHNPKTFKIPVLLLTGYDKNDDIIKGFENGCNDYIPKPYTFNILLVRLKNILQSAEQIPEMITKGRLRLEMTPMAALINDTDMMLSPKEFALLLFLVQHENEVVPMQYLYEQVWRKPMINDAGALKKTISRVRSRLDGSGFTVNAQRGEGYCFEREI